MSNANYSSVCLVCQVALSGPLALVSRLGGIRRGSGNPNLCNRCGSHAAEGRIVEVAVFFVDLTGYTTLTRELGPQRMSEILDAFLRRTKDTVVRWDGFVSQFVGDEVMVFFNAPLKRDNYAELAVNAAVEVREQMRKLSAEMGQTLDVTIGIAAGYAQVGHVGSEEIAHYSAVGDVVNRAARFVARVPAGGVLIDESIYQAVAEQFPQAKIEVIELKGFDEPVAAALLAGELVSEAVSPAAARYKKIALTTTITALLSAPCVGFLALNAAGIALGIGAVAMGSLALFLDQSVVRIPLLIAATIGALLILNTLRQTRSSASAIERSMLAPASTSSERRRNRLGLTAAVAALLIVVGELFAHAAMH